MNHPFVIEPEFYTAFENEEAQLEKCKEWGLLSEKATKTKTFYYKGYRINTTCTIIGYADDMTAVVEFDNSQKHCIHPSYLKEMQASGFNQRLTGAGEDSESAQPDVTEAETPQEAKTASAAQEAPAVDNVNVDEPETAADESKTEAVPTKNDESKPEEPAKGKAKKEKAKKLELPEAKVKMTATVLEFTTVPNHFSETDDEVIIYDAVAITEPGSEAEVGSAWSSHSNTLKKLDLQVGDTITFEGKIAAKKLTKHPVPYKINNPAKIQKQ